MDGHLSTRANLAEARRADIVMAAHGPYTAAGVTEVTGIHVDVVGKAFGSFHGVVTALEEHFAPKPPASRKPSQPSSKTSKAGSSSKTS
jgi:hypothetical protein